ncbi:hypothetical protein EC968_006739 [Mortierella alpina]|nr:hypothetical protein EC968_006739 [Mortierella alpina]
MASILQLLLERRHLSPVMSTCKHAPFKFAIVVSGFEPRDAEKLAWYTNQYPVVEALEASTLAKGGEDSGNAIEDGSTKGEDEVKPRTLFGVQGASMHVIGRNDVIIEPERSEGLLKHYGFHKPVTLYHEGGHYLPSNAVSRQAYKAFVQSFAA